MCKTGKITKKALTAIEKSVKMLEKANDFYEHSEYFDGHTGDEFTAGMFIQKAIVAVDGFHELVNRLKESGGCEKVNLGKYKAQLEKMDVVVAGIVEKTKSLYDNDCNGDWEKGVDELENDTVNLRYFLEDIKQCIYEILPPVCSYWINANHLEQSASDGEKRSKMFTSRGMMALYKAAATCDRIARAASKAPISLKSYACLKNALDLSLVFKRAIELGKIEPDYLKFESSINSDLIKRFYSYIEGLYWGIEGFHDCAVLLGIDKPDNSNSDENIPPEYTYDSVYSGLFYCRFFYSKLFEHVELAWFAAYKVDAFHEPFIAERLEREKKSSEKMLSAFLSKNPKIAGSLIERYAFDTRIVETRYKCLRFIDWFDDKMDWTKTEYDGEIFIK